ncbi:hypothetical protein [Amycolatopsis sp.]|nr:hypothetical protein [Amycolatopsis sp.]HET6703616.1 hypothetical protein [Amycolatopsis sp.]
MTAAAVPADDWTPPPAPEEPRGLRLVEAPEPVVDDHIVLGYN